jgi:hypothetical protein
MRNIPVDITALSFVCVSPPRPKLVDQDTGEVKVDRDGQTVYTVGLSAANELGRVELLNVSVSGDPGVTIGQVVTPVGLVAFPWEQQTNGRLRWGIAYRADQVIPVASTAPVSASSGTPASPPASSTAAA